ncbi:MAG: hypothetical protein E6689_12085 [Corynebacterium striatum]|uniref:hypothetical protein n=1 Tax=Corynebacterium sp. c25Ua_89 TaxID=3032356 RepID=UPI00288B776B|nr:hypothetical protein [uncultured Corynebacterium sp.]MDU3176140.1 hypothetical protein [Corynebacterium striatum]
MSSHPGTSPARLRTRFFAKAKAKGAQAVKIEGGGAFACRSRAFLRRRRSLARVPE